MNGILLVSSFCDVFSAVSRQFSGTRCLPVVTAESGYKCGSSTCEQNSRLTTVWVWGGGSSNIGSVSHVYSCRKNRLGYVTVSLDRQKDINRNSSVTQLIYLKIINIILITKERVLNNMSYYLLQLIKSPLTRIHS